MGPEISRSQEWAGWTYVNVSTDIQYVRMYGRTTRKHKAMAVVGTETQKDTGVTCVE